MNLNKFYNCLKTKVNQINVSKKKLIAWIKPFWVIKSNLWILVILFFIIVIFYFCFLIKLDKANIDNILNLLFILSLIFAVFTYWINKYNEFKLEKNLRFDLQTEIRTVYFCMLDEIERYDLVRSHNFSVPFYQINKFHKKNYPCSTINLISKDNCFITYFNLAERRTIIYLRDLIKEANEFKTYGLIDKSQLNWYFEYRLLDLKNIILELAIDYNCIDMSIVPKGALKNKRHEQLENKERSSWKIIEEFLITNYGCFKTPYRKIKLDDI